MRSIFILFIMAVSCKSNVDQHGKPDLSPSASSFAFLLGQWNRVNTQDGETTYEHWTLNGDHWQGHAYTLKSQDTLFQEWTSIVESDIAWIYRVRISGDSIATDFQMTAITDSSFMCQNLHNEYPKNIFYSKRKDQLYAKISGGGPEIEYFFEKN